MELDTITAMEAGSGPVGGGALFPGAVDQPPPHAGRLAGAFAKPLNAAGAPPPLRSFAFHHCAPQNVTAVPIAAFLSPIANVPPAAPAKISTLQLVVVLLPPVSAIEIVIVNVPVVAKVWLPLTVNAPPFGPVTVPAVVEPSPQPIVAVYSAAVAAESASVKLATAPENTAPSVALMFVGVATMSASLSQLTVTSL